MRRLARLAAAALVAAASLGVGATWAVQDAESLGSWRVQRWLEGQPGVTAVQDYRCGSPGPTTGSVLLPRSCATLRTSFDAAGLARFSTALHAYRAAHPGDPAGLVEVQAPWGASLVGFRDDGWVLAAVRIATSVPGHGPVSIVGGEASSTATVVVPTREGLADLAADLSQELPASGPPEAFPSGLGFVGPRGRVYVTGPSRVDELGRRAFTEASAGTPDVAVLLRRQADEPAVAVDASAPDPAGFVVTLGPGAAPDTADRLAALGVGVPTTRSWVEHRSEPVARQGELFSAQDPAADDPESRLRTVRTWAAGVRLDAVRAVPGVLDASVDVSSDAAPSVPGGDPTVAVVVTVRSAPATWVDLEDLAAALPAEATGVVVEARSASGSEPVVAVPAGELREIAPLLDRVATDVRPDTLAWLAGENGTRARLRVGLGPADDRELDRLLTTLATGGALESRARWADVAVTIGGQDWTVVLDLDGPGVSAGNYSAPQSATEARGRALESRLAARWATLLASG